jgi:CubicO group peptidase (beta-lactamase class C family)
MGDGQLRARLDALAGIGGAVSAIELAVVAGGREIFRHAAGWRGPGERLATGARFDAASLTKPWMATLALALDALGTLALATEVGAIFPASAAALARRTLEDLLRHRAGLLPWTPLALRLGRRLGEREALERLLTGSELLAPDFVPGTYSDLGYLLWGLAAERASGESLADLVDRRVAAPLGLAPVGALSVEPPEAVECRLDNAREAELARAQGFEIERRPLRLAGRPQDGNARVLARLCGHAGLFVTLDELIALAREWRAPARLLDPGGVSTALAGGTGWALGWARSSADGSSGPAFSPAAFGHAGFTGGALWIDPERDRIVATLAHRLDPLADFNPIRRELHELALGLDG